MMNQVDHGIVAKSAKKSRMMIKRNIRETKKKRKIKTTNKGGQYQNSPDQIGKQVGEASPPTLHLYMIDVLDPILVVVL